MEVRVPLRVASGALPRAAREQASAIRRLAAPETGWRSAPVRSLATPAARAWAQQPRRVSLRLLARFGALVLRVPAQARLLQVQCPCRAGRSARCRGAAGGCLGRRGAAPAPR